MSPTNSQLRVVFLERLPMEKLGIMYLCAIVRRRGHTPFVFLEGAERDLLARVEETKPDLVAFSITTGMHRWALDTAARIKSRIRTKIIFGGPHASYTPEVIEQGPIDLVCRGEGERVMEEILERMESGRALDDVANLWVRRDGAVLKNDVRPLIENLDEIPFPDREVYYKYPYLARQRSKALLTGRGCDYLCTFCHNPLDLAIYEGKGTWVRKRSPENIVEEIRDLKDRYRLEEVNMEKDDHLLIHREWSFRFLDVYAREVGLPFVFQCRPEAVDRPIADALKAARCAAVTLSVETASQKLRNKLLKKQISDSVVIDAVKLLKDRGIFVKTLNMIGLPGETYEDALATLRLNIALGPHFARCSIATPFPKTEFFRQSVEAGLISPDYCPDDYYEDYFQESILNHPEGRRISNLQKFFSLTVTFPWLLPIVKLLVRLPPNPIFYRFYLAAFAWYASRYAGLSLKNVIDLGLRSPKRLRPPPRPRPEDSPVR